MEGLHVGGEYAANILSDLSVWDDALPIASTLRSV